MKKYTATLLLFFITSMAYASVIDSKLLPEKYKVYYIENMGVVNHPVPNSHEKILPTINDFKEAPGCYVACYSHYEANSVYPISKNIYVMGQIRVPGSYANRICQPKGFEDKDISTVKAFNALCTKHLPEPCPDNSCWVGGDTGGWFGVQ